jgi:hypothetical protein
MARPDSKATDAEQSLKSLFRQPLYSLMDSLCVNYINTKCYHGISAIHTAVGAVEAALTATATSDSTDNEKNHVLKKRVRSALQVIEDLLMAAMEDWDITTMRQGRLLHHQSLGTS